MLFHRPVLSRIDLGLIRSAGPGLGNLLFPIARAILGAERLGGVMVHPTLRQAKLGPILRGEPDKRLYGDVLRHRSLRDMAVWLRAGLVAQIDEGEEATAPAGDVAVRYAGMARYFHDLAGGEATVRRWIETHARQRGAVQTDYDIAVHVRLGDFASAGGSTANTRLTLDWYADAIDLARRTLGGAAPTIMLFTDGAAAELAPLQARFAMMPDPGRNALTSIRNISRARILIASRSTFSMWGAYLGDVPAIWDATFDHTPFLPDRGGLDLVL